MSVAAPGGLKVQSWMPVIWLVLQWCSPLSAQQPVSNPQPTGITVQGTVVDEQGQPIPQALVKAVMPTTKRETRTDDLGHYELTEVAPGEIRLVVAVPGKALFRRWLKLEQDSVQDMQLALGQHLRVKVLDHTGQPIPAAYISIFREANYNPNIPSASYHFLEVDHVPHTTNPEGIWEWHECPEEGFRGSIFAGETQMIQPEVVLKPGPEICVVKLFPPLAITGTVVDAETGQPYLNFSIFQA